MKMAELITIMRADLERLPTFFSKVVVVWSEMVPRVVWRGARNSAAIERAFFVRDRLVVVVRHYQLEGDNRALMMPDGVHLNEIGMNIFLSGLQDGVDKALFLLGGGS